MTDTAHATDNPRPAFRRKLALLAVAVLVGLSAGEIALQLLGVEIRAERIVRDPVLGWRNRAGWQGATYAINSWGCLGPEVEVEKPEGTTRVICLGDSCTAGDLLPSFEDTYPRQLAEELGRRYPARKFEVINAGVGGYSSFQGRVWLERELIRLQPDVLVVYFGWNDHWPSRSGGTDSEVSGSFGERARAWLAWSKVVQLAAKAWHVVLGRDVVPAGEGTPAAGSSRPPRVSRAEYRGNLVRMAELMGERGGRTVFITAPNYLALAGEQQDFFSDRAASEAIVRVHASYCGVVREVAHDVRASLVDAAERFREKSGHEQLFWRPAPSAPLDFIHLSATGYGELARLVAECGAFQEAAATR